MGRTKKMEENAKISIADVDLNEEPVMQVVEKETKEVYREPERQRVVEYDKPLVNCLRKERIIVRHVPKKGGLVTDKKHVLSDGMADGARNVFTVPKLSSGLFVNVLTDSEKDYLEYIMGLEKNALSIYKKNDNFWSDSNPNGVNRVILFKQDNYLDLSNPEDYIRYKILLANKMYICPSLKQLKENPLKTYKYVIIEQNMESSMNEMNIDAKQRCWMNFGKIDSDRAMMAMVIQLVEGRSVSSTSDISWLKARIDDLINKDASKVLAVMEDKNLRTKVLLKKAITAGMVVEKGTYLYYKDGDKTTPLCDEREEPTFDTAARFLDQPKNQQLKFDLEEQLNRIK